MGRSSQTIHIHNKDGLTKAAFKKTFSDTLKSRGYTKADEENAELSYTLAFSPDRKWVAVLTEDEQDIGRAAAEFAKALGTEVVNAEIVDSDFAELSLFDGSGKHADTLTLGESYLGDDAPKGSEECWSPLLNGSVWEQVAAIRDGSYTYAEEALAEFAPIIGMDSGNILLDNDDTPDKATVLYFKRAKDKKLTLNSAFVKYFGELLIPYGFVKKTINKRPYFIRVINCEILQVVTYRQISARKVGFKTFEIYCGIMSLYRAHIDLTQSPECDLDDMDSLISSSNFIAELGEELVKRAVEYNVSFWNRKKVYSLDYEFHRIQFHFSPEFLTGMEIARDIAEKVLPPRFENTKTIERCIEYFYENGYRMNFYGPDEEVRELHDTKSFDIKPRNVLSEAMTLIVGGYKKDITRYTEPRLEKRAQLIEEGYNGLQGARDIEDYKARYRNKINNEIEIRNIILDTPELKARALEYAEEVRQKNVELLRSYGLDI